MTKKDFQAIARALHSIRPAGKDADGIHEYKAEFARVDYWRPTVGMVADVLAASNPRFDRVRFIEACETGRCKGMPR